MSRVAGRGFAAAVLVVGALAGIVAFVATFFVRGSEPGPRPSVGTEAAAVSPIYTRLPLGASALTMAAPTEAEPPRSPLAAAGAGRPPSFLLGAPGALALSVLVIGTVLSLRRGRRSRVNGR
jgi:hypothetical protein